MAGQPQTGNGIWTKATRNAQGQVTYWEDRLGNVGLTSIEFPDGTTQTTAPGSGNTSPVSLFSNVTSLVAYGDSITAGIKLPVAKQNWAQLISDALNLSLTNNGASGARLYQTGFIASAYATTPVSTVASIGLYGTNEMSDAALSSANQTTIANAMRSMAVWLSLSPSKVVLTSGMTKSGFGSSTTFAGLTAVFSSTANDTLTATVNGTAVYVTGYVDSGFTSKFDVLVDGVSTSAGVGYTMTNAMTNYTGHYPFTLRFAGYTAGNHTVVVKVLAGSGFVPIQWIAGNGSGDTIVNIMAAAGPQTGISAGTIQAVNTNLSTICTNLQSDGLQCFYSDTYTPMTASDPPLYMSDNLHPSMFGNFILANQVLSTVYTGTANITSFTTMCVNAGLTPEKLLAMYAAFVRGIVQTDIADTTTSGGSATSGAGSALPTTPVGYMIVNRAGNTYKIPYYNI